MSPEPLRSVALALIVVAPRSMFAFAVERIPARLVVAGPVVVSSPPANEIESAAPLPSVTAPVLRKLVSAVTAKLEEFTTTE